MGLDISKIANEQLKKLAYLKDEDNNSILDEQEYSIFKTEAAEVEGVSADDFNQAIGLFKSEEAKTVTAPEELESNNTHFDKKAFNRAKNLVLRYIDNLTGSCTRENLIEKIDELLGENKDDPRYVAVKSDIEKVMSLMKESYSSHNDINESYQSTCNKMCKEGIEDLYHQQILNKLEKIAKTEVNSNIKQEIQTRYDELASEESDTKKSDAEIMDQIKDEFQAAGKYNFEHRAVYKNFENENFMRQAKNLVYDVIDENKDDTKWIQIRNKAREELKENGKWDKYTKRAFRKPDFGDRITDDVASGIVIRTRYGVEVAKSRARKNKVAQSQIKSEKDVLKGLSHNSKEVYEALINSGIITVDENKNVDLSLLTALIQKQVGTDNIMNRNAKIDTAISEKFKTACRLSSEINLNDLTEKEAKELAKICGIEYERKDWRKIVGGALTHGLTSFLGDRGAAALAKGVFVKISDYEVKTTIHNVTSDMINVDLPSDMVSITDYKTDTGFGVDIIIKIGEGSVDIPANIPINWYTIALGAAIGALKETINDRGEVPVTSTQFEETDFNKYMENTKVELTRLKAGSYYEILHCIASAYIQEDGSWDHEGYKKMLNKMAGDGGKLNKQELLDGCKLYQQGIPEEEEKEEKEAPEVCNAIVSYETSEEVVETQDLTKIHTRKGGDTWRGLVNAYYPKLVEACNGQMFGSNGAIRELKKALSVNEDGTFNHDTYLKLLNGGDLPKIIKLPLEIKGTKRFDGTVVAERVHGNGRALIDKVGKDEIKVTKIPGTNVYKAVDGCDCEVAPAYGTTVEEAVANLKEKTGKEYKEIITE